MTFLEFLDRNGTVIALLLIVLVWALPSIIDSIKGNRSDDSDD